MRLCKYSPNTTEVISGVRRNCRSEVPIVFPVTNTPLRLCINIRRMHVHALFPRETSRQRRVPYDRDEYYLPLETVLSKTA